eukprot:6176763-Pleurochrysis_carterae.AAC.1
MEISIPYSKIESVEMHIEMIRTDRLSANDSARTRIRDAVTFILSEIKLLRTAMNQRFRRRREMPNYELKSADLQPAAQQQRIHASQTAAAERPGCSPSHD